MQADNLKVHSENCVVLLLSAWVKNMRHLVCNAQLLEQLADHVRVAHLSPSYLHTVLPDLDWFRARVDQLRYYLIREATKGEYSIAPQQWTGKPRNRTVASLPAVTFNAKFTLELIESLDNPEALEAHWPRSTEKVYANGYFFRCVIAPSINAADATTLGLFLQMDTTFLCSVFGFSGSEAAEVSFTLPTAVTSHISSIHIRTLLSDEACGIDDCLGRSAPTLKEVVAPFLVDGKLQVSLDIRDVK